MGAKTAKRAYGELDKARTGEHQMYFKGQETTIVLSAFIEPVVGSHPQLVIVTQGGVSVYDWKTGKERYTLHMEVKAADVATDLAGKKVLTYVGSNNIVFIAEPSTSESTRQVSFSEKVTVLKLIPGAWLIVGFEVGRIALVRLSDLAVSQLESTYLSPVNTLASASDLIVAGYQSVQSDPRTKLMVFRTTQDSTGSSCEWLTGTCAAICLLESESLILALADKATKIEFWDLHNQNYLIGLNISSTPLTCFLAQENSQQGVTLVLGGTDVTIGELVIGEDSMSWTPKRKSTFEGKAKVRLGTVTTLQMETTFSLLVYGDDQGQAWLVDLSTPSS